MLKIEKYRKQLVSLSVLDIGAFTERYDLGELICNNPDEFFGEIGQRLFVIGKNIQLSDTVEIAVDLVAVDMKGSGGHCHPSAEQRAAASVAGCYVFRYPCTMGTGRHPRPFVGRAKKGSGGFLGREHR